MNKKLKKDGGVCEIKGRWKRMRHIEDEGERERETRYLYRIKLGDWQNEVK